MEVLEYVRGRFLNARWIALLSLVICVVVGLVFRAVVGPASPSYRQAEYWQATPLKHSRVEEIVSKPQGLHPEWTQNLTLFQWDWNPKVDANNFLLSQRQCEVGFPGLFDDVDRLVKQFGTPANSIRLHDLDKLQKVNGYVRAMIHDHQLYVISTGGPIYSRSFAVLAQIYRAVSTSPESVPNIEFTFSVDDWLPPLPQWAFARKHKDRTTWLMPDFGFWSWPETKVGSFAEARLKAGAVDTDLNWSDKQRQLLWRGANMSLGLRTSLIKATAEKEWADVQNLDWHPGDGAQIQGLKSMSEHCQYRYLAQTEGNSYSGRLKYLQLCRSVVIAHPMEWVTHYSHLMKKDGPEQSFVQVRADWSDLESTILHLEKDDVWAESIANNNVVTFRERYLTPAAEVCYWRRLFKGWAEATDFEPELYDVASDGTKQLRGIPFESYILERRLEWDPY